MAFRPTAFFDGFTRYLQDDRTRTVRFLALAASFEHWVQFEAAAWIDQNRTVAGIDADHWSINLELRKGDVSLINDEDLPSVSIEFKCIYNNKNCPSRIRELRRDLSDDKPLPWTASRENTLRFGVAILIYLRYQKGRQGGYQTLGGLVRDPWPPAKFIDYFKDACVSADSSYGTFPKLRLCSDIVQVACLDGGIGIDPACPGSAVWLALTAPQYQDL